MTRITQLGYLGLGVSDPESWLAFATQLLGLQVSESEDGRVLLRMDEHNYRFALHSGGSDDVAYVGWQVANEEALTEVCDVLKGRGVAVTRGTAELAAERRVQGLIQFKDPSGIASEVYYGPLVTYDVPFQSPRGVTGFVAGHLGLGHAVFAVDDQAASLEFYRDVLGLRISDRMRVSRPGLQGEVVFLHCNPRHHSLALVPLKAERRLRHFMLELSSLDDVGRAYDLGQASGAATRAIGRHPNDHMVSCYLRSPSGFEVEYGWGARVVDDNVWEVQTQVAPSIWGHQVLQAGV